MKRKLAIVGSRIGWILLVPVMAGCASVSQVDQPTLVRVFADLRQAPHKEPVIIIPGALGSILEDTATGRVVWGRVHGAQLAALGLPIEGATLRENRDHIVAKNILERMVWVPNLVEFKVSNDLIRALQEAGGYDKGDLAHPQPGDNCFLFWYDWRRDLVEAAQQLGAAIDRLATEMHDPELKVHLIAYSMGGLVARYYVKYGAVDVLDQDPLPPPSYAGARHVAQVILLGTPNNGSLETFRSLQEGVAVPGIGHFSAATVFTMPAAYQLLPHDDETVFVDPQGNPLEVSLDDPANWQRYGWSVFNPFMQAEHGVQQQRFLAMALARAQRFHHALDHGDPAGDPVEYVVLGSDCRPTLQRAVLEPQGSRWRTRFTTEDPQLNDRLFGFGDGSVTKESLLGSHHSGIDRASLARSSLRVAYAVFVCEAHVRLTQNLTFLDNLLHALLVREATAQHQATCLHCQRRVGEVAAGGIQPRRTADAATAVDHAVWDQLLRRHVSHGLMDYKGLQAERRALDAYLAQISAVDPAQLSSPEAQLAFWINAYNAYVVQGVLDHYPITSVKDIHGFFDRIRYAVAGERLTLNAMEAKGRALGDWRIHAAVVCAAVSCPPLRSEAYVPSRLDEQLTEQTKRWLQDGQRGLRLEGNTLRVSLVLKWYAKDVLPQQRLTAETLVAALQPYLDPAVVRAAGARRLVLEFFTYDWSLNDADHP